MASTSIPPGSPSPVVTPFPEEETEADSSVASSSLDQGGDEVGAGVGGVARLPGTVRPLLVLAVPVLIEQTLALGVGFTDKWLSGNLLPGPEYLAAVGLVAYCLAFLPAVFAVASVSVT